MPLFDVSAGLLRWLVAAGQLALQFFQFLAGNGRHWRVVGRPINDQWLALGRPLADRWPTVGRPMADRWPTDGRPMALVGFGRP